MSFQPARDRATATLVIGAFLLVTTEFAVVGLAVELSSSLAITPAQYGLIVSVFALGAALGGPVLVVCSARFSSRRVLMWSLAPFTGNLVFVVSPDFGSILVLRAIQGAALPVFISFANVWLAEKHGAGKGTAVLYMGVVAGGAFAPAIGAGLALVAGWKIAMAGIGLAALLGTVAVGCFLKDHAPHSAPPALPQPSLRDGLRLAPHLALTVFVFTALFASYAHILLGLERAGYRADFAAIFLVVFGLSGFAGNWLAAKATGVLPIATSCAVVLVALCSAILQADILRGAVAGAILAMIWGSAHAASFVLSQVRLISAGPEFPAFASSLNISAGNIGIALGSALGGLALSHSGSGVLVGAVSLALAVLASITASVIPRGKVA